tara:strand:+ start:134 stop:589 length:456 start_codon:yes stop_codon:yes gene_type:complete
MAILDTNKKQLIQDRDENIYIGIDLPFRRSLGKEGYFASTKTTIEAIKNNIRNLVNTHQGERLMQPALGLNLKKYLFEPVISDDTILSLQKDLTETISNWLPFVVIQKIDTMFTSLNDSTGQNVLKISIVFNIKNDPQSMEQLDLEIGGEV